MADDAPTTHRRVAECDDQMYDALHPHRPSSFLLKINGMRLIYYVSVHTVLWCSGIEKDFAAAAAAAAEYSTATTAAA